MSHYQRAFGALITIAVAGAAGGCQIRNSTTRTPQPPAATELLVAAPPVVQERLAPAAQPITFAFDRTEPRTGNDAHLAYIAGVLLEIQREFPDVSFIVEGYCDDSGAAGYNRDLGFRRASAVRQRLISLGVPAAQVRSLSFAAENPVCTGRDRLCRQRNRRVEIRAVVRAVEIAETE